MFSTSVSVMEPIQSPDSKCLMNEKTSEIEVVTPIQPPTTTAQIDVDIEKWPGQSQEHVSRVSADISSPQSAPKERHGKQNPFICKYCNRTFAYRSGLYQHRCPDRRKLSKLNRDKRNSEVVPKTDTKPKKFKLTLNYEKMRQRLICAPESEGEEAMTEYDHRGKKQPFYKIFENVHINN